MAKGKPTITKPAQKPKPPPQAKPAEEKNISRLPPRPPRLFYIGNLDGGNGITGMGSQKRPRRQGANQRIVCYRIPRRSIPARQPLFAIDNNLHPHRSRPGAQPQVVAECQRNRPLARQNKTSGIDHSAVEDVCCARQNKVSHRISPRQKKARPPRDHQTKRMAKNSAKNPENPPPAKIVIVIPAQAGINFAQGANHFGGKAAAN